MGFLKKLFGGGGEAQTKKPAPYVDTQGIYFYVQCDNCGAPVKLRVDKQYDLFDEGDGYVWHKTIVDNRCFRRIPTVVHLNRQYEVVSQTIEGGRYITEETYQALLAVRQGSRGAEEQGG
jgi:hypothetical protein